MTHTDLDAGDCCYLDTCRHMKTCKYVHYEIDDSFEAAEDSSNPASTDLVNLNVTQRLLERELILFVLLSQSKWDNGLNVMCVLFLWNVLENFL